ncbi:hypothetical protein ABK040_005630 [Willaertia magna]
MSLLKTEKELKELSWNDLKIYAKQHELKVKLYVGGTTNRTKLDIIKDILKAQQQQYEEEEKSLKFTYFNIDKHKLQEEEKKNVEEIEEVKEEIEERLIVNNLLFNKEEQDNKEEMDNFKFIVPKLVNGDSLIFNSRKEEDKREEEEKTDDNKLIIPKEELLKDFFKHHEFFIKKEEITKDYNDFKVSPIKPFTFKQKEETNKKEEEEYQSFKEDKFTLKTELSSITCNLNFNNYNENYNENYNKLKTLDKQLEETKDNTTIKEENNSTTTTHQRLLFIFFDTEGGKTNHLWQQTYQLVGVIDRKEKQFELHEDIFFEAIDYHNKTESLVFNKVRKWLNGWKKRTNSTAVILTGFNEKNHDREIIKRSNVNNQTDNNENKTDKTDKEEEEQGLNDIYFLDIYLWLKKEVTLYSFKLKRIARTLKLNYNYYSEKKSIDDVLITIKIFIIYLMESIEFNNDKTQKELDEKRKEIVKIFNDKEKDEERKEIYNIWFTKLITEKYTYILNNKKSVVCNILEYIYRISNRELFHNLQNEDVYFKVY